MTFVRRVARGLERRSTLTNPSDALRQAFTGASTYSGKQVSVETALTLGPVFAASSLVAGAVGGVPLKVYNSGREEARSSRQWRMLHDEPNDEMAADELWELVAHQLLMWGNAFLLKDRDGLGVVQMLWPIRPGRMTVGREPAVRGRARRFYQVDGQPKKYYDDSFLHIRGLGSDGLVGYSVIQQARQQLGNMLSQDEFQGRFWANGSFMGAALLHPQQMSADAQDRLKKQISAKRGVAESNGIWVFEEDMKFQQLGMPLRDAEFMAQMKMGRLAVAELFGLVPPHRWGNDQRSLTYANVEAASTDFVRWTGRRWWSRIEKSLQRDQGVFPKSGPSLTAEFQTADLLRGDTKTRYETYQIGIAAGVLTRNEARGFENLPPLDSGDGITEPSAADE